MKNADEYDIRDYPERIVAQTTVEDMSYRESLNEGFRRVAGFIFGGNMQNQKIAMTAPVQVGPPTKIAMTAPVMAQDSPKGLTVSFGMPRAYTLDTLPTPKDSRVRIVRIPQQRFAARTFSGYFSVRKFQEERSVLLAALARDGKEAMGQAEFAGYNAPWTPPWMMRNEVLVLVDGT